MYDRIQYRLMWAFYRFVWWFKYRLTSAGKLVLLGLVFSGSLAWTPNKTLAYQIAPFLLLILIFSLASGFFFKIRLRVQRRLPRIISVGQKVTYKCSLENITETPQTGLALMEIFKDIKPSYEQFVTMKMPPQSGGGWIRRIMAQDKIRIRAFKETRVFTRDQPLPVLLPRKKLEIENSFIPLVRGYLRFVGMDIIRQDPLGVYGSTVTIPCEESLLVIPRMYKTPVLHLGGSRKHNQKGISLASHIGESEEFVSLRDYRPGDPLRTIHWKSWAKVGKPVVKQYQEEYFSRYALILDTFTPSASQRFEEAVSVAASFSANIDLGESLLDILFVGTESHRLTTGRSLGRIDQILEILATVKHCPDQPFSALNELVSSRSSLLSGGICVLLGWDEERQKLVRHLRAAHVPLKVFVVLDEGAEPAIDPGPMKDRPDDFKVLMSGRIEEGLKDL